MTSIGKDTFLFGVGMQINKHSNSFLVIEDISFYCMDLSGAIGSTSFPCSVEVIACNVAARIAQNYSIRVDHGNDFDDIVL